MEDLARESIDSTNCLFIRSLSPKIDHLNCGPRESKVCDIENEYENLTIPQNLEPSSNLESWSVDPESKETKLLDFVQKENSVLSEITNTNLWRRIGIQQKKREIEGKENLWNQEIDKKDFKEKNYKSYNYNEKFIETSELLAFEKIDLTDTSEIEKRSEYNTLNFSHDYNPLLIPKLLETKKLNYINLQEELIKKLFESIESIEKIVVFGSEFNRGVNSNYDIEVVKKYLYMNCFFFHLISIIENTNQKGLLVLIETIKISSTEFKNYTLLVEKLEKLNFYLHNKEEALEYIFFKFILEKRILREILCWVEELFIEKIRVMAFDSMEEKIKAGKFFTRKDYFELEHKTRKTTLKTDLVFLIKLYSELFDLKFNIKFLSSKKSNEHENRNKSYEKDIKKAQK